MATASETVYVRGVYAVLVRRRYQMALCVVHVDQQGGKYARFPDADGLWYHLDDRYVCAGLAVGVTPCAYWPAA